MKSPAHTRTRFGRYVLLDQIARGGMAEVWLATDLKGRPVAVKRILEHLAHDDAFISMFLNEARLAAKLQHRNIVAVRDLGEHHGIFYVAMDFVDGYNLKEISQVAWRTTMPIRLSGGLVAEACAGLDYAHRFSDTRGPLGLVHRDVTPENIMIGVDGRVQILDFGIARATQESFDATTSGVLQGKFRFMAPEVIRSRTADFRSDIFSLGVVLYWLTTRTHPFEADDQAGVLGRIVHSDPVKPSELNPDVPAELDDIVFTALAKSPSDRFASMAHFRASLLKFLGEPMDQGMLALWLRSAATFEDGCATRAVHATRLGSPRVNA